MRASPDRRRLLRAGGLALLGAVSGCTSAGTGTDTATPTETPPERPRVTGTYAHTPDGPEPYPDRPDDLARESVLEYVEAFEFARTKNGLHGPDLEEAYVDCRGVYDTAAHGGHYAMAACGGYANYADGTHADLGSAPELYFVSPRLTVRIEGSDSRHLHCTEVFAAADPDENFAEECSGGDASYRVYNYHPEPQTVAVTVTFLGNEESSARTTSAVALDRTYELGPTSGMTEESVTYRKGTYRVRATLENGFEATFRWELQSEPEYDDPPLAVVVTPVGGVAIRHVPTQKAR